MSPTGFRLFCSRTFQPGSEIAKLPYYGDIALQQIGKSSLAPENVSSIILMEFRKAVWALGKEKNRDLVDRLRHRRWLIDQAKKWGFASKVIHDNMMAYGGNFWKTQ